MGKFKPFTSCMTLMLGVITFLSSSNTYASSSEALDQVIESLEPTHHYVVDDLNGGHIPNRAGGAEVSIWAYSDAGRYQYTKGYLKDVQGHVSQKALFIQDRSLLSIQERLNASAFENGLTWVYWVKRIPGNRSKNWALSQIQSSEISFKVGTGLRDFSLKFDQLKYLDRVKFETKGANQQDGQGWHSEKSSENNLVKGLIMAVARYDGETISLYIDSEMVEQTPFKLKGNHDFSASSYLGGVELYRTALFNKPLNLEQIELLYKSYKFPEQLSQNADLPNLEQFNDNHQLLNTIEGSEQFVPGVDKHLWQQAKALCGFLEPIALKTSLAPTYQKSRKSFLSKAAELNQQRLEKCLNENNLYKDKTLDEVISSDADGSAGDDHSLEATQGQFRVDETGQATYSIPFSLPDGIAGVKPQLGLTYSSSGGPGLAG